VRDTPAHLLSGDIAPAGDTSPASSGSVTTYRVRPIAGPSVEAEDFRCEAPTPVVRPEIPKKKRFTRTRADIQSEKSSRIRGSETRKVRHRGRETYCGDVPMPRLQYKLVSGDSLLECDFVIVTDATEDDLIDVQSQPKPLAIFVDGRKRKWRPDYLIRRQGFAAELIEVKYLQWLHSKNPVKAAERRAWLSACAAAARENGFVFRLLTEQEIRVEPRLSNAYLAHRHLGPFIDKSLLMKAILALPSLTHEPTVAKLGQAIDAPLRALEMAIRLDRLNFVRLDRSAVYSANSRFLINVVSEQAPT